MKKINYFEKSCFIALFLIGSMLFCSCTANYRQNTVSLSDSCGAEQQTAAYEIIIKRLSSIGTIKEKSALTNGRFDVTYLFEDTTVCLIPLISQKGEVYISQTTDSLNAEQAQKLYLNPTTVEKVEVVKETPSYVPKGSCIYNLTIDLKKEYHEVFARLTEENVNKPLPIIVDGKIIASPVVHSAITEGKLSITGKFELSEMYILKAFIASGVLPCEAKIIGGSTNKKKAIGSNYNWVGTVEKVSR